MTVTSSFKSYGQVEDPNVIDSNVQPGARCLPKVAPTSPIQRGSCKRVAIIVGLVVVLVVIVCVAVAVSLAHKSHHGSVSSSSKASSVMNTLCQSTMYPDECVALMLSSGITNSTTDVRTIVNTAVSAAIAAVTQLKQTVTDLSVNETDADVSAALADCQTLLDDSLENLNSTFDTLTSSASLNDLLNQFDDLADAMSAALTDETTCVDGFQELTNDSSANATIHQEGKVVNDELSIALALVTSFTSLGTDLSTWSTGLANRGLIERHMLAQEDGYPSWFDNVVRRSLQASTSGVTVAQDGTGNYKTIQAAVNAAPKKLTSTYTIYIKSGVYSEQVTIPSNKPYLKFVGDGIGNTIITGNLNIMMSGVTTFLSATLIVGGANFIGRGFTVRNTAGPLNQQAVALRVSADKVAFWQVSIEGYQDTLYAHSHRQFYKDCLIAGTVDFMFGNGAVVFQTCKIVVRLPTPGQQNTVTAQGRTDPSQTTGLAYYNCSIDGNVALLGAHGTVASYLGRPWKLYSRTVYIRTYLGGIINPAGWLIWVGDWALSTCYYAEYQNFGPGSNTAQRVSWSRQLTSASQVNVFSIANFISGNSWLQSASVPFTSTTV